MAGAFTVDRDIAAVPRGVGIAWMTGLGEIRGLETEWRKLEARVSRRTVFSTYDMVLPWYDWYARTYGTPLLGVARRGTELVGIAPLILRSRNAAGIPIRRVEFALFNLHAGEFLVEDGAPEVAGLFLSSLARRGGVDLICLYGFLPGTEILEIVLRSGRDAGLSPMETPYHCARVDLRNGYEGYDRFMGHTARSKRKRVKNLVEKAGIPGLERIPATGQPSEPDRLLERSFRIADKGWRARKAGLDEEHKHHRFYGDVARRFARRGMLDLCVLTVGGRDASFVMGIVERGTYFEVVTAYDESMKDCAPGVFVLNELIKLLPGSGVRILDSQGDYDFKRRWATEFFLQVRLTFFPRTIRGRVVRADKILLPAIRNRFRRLVCRDGGTQPGSDAPAHGNDA